MLKVTGYILKDGKLVKAPKKQPKTEAEKQLAAEAKKRLARAFETEWRRCDGPELEKEYRFHPVREWRFDYALPPLKIAVEVEGAVWSNGRHTRGSGFIKDCIKYNSAAALGWTVFRLPEALIEKPDHLKLIIEFIKAKQAAYTK
jgi:very-short-patch-repair endonuclease